MTKQDLARICLAMIISGFAAVAVTKVGISQPSGIARWLVFCLVAGIVMNSPHGMALWQVAIGAVLAALSFTLALLWMALLGAGKLKGFSGVDLDLYESPTYFIAVLGGSLIASTFGVAIASLARPATLTALEELGKVEVSKAKNIEAFLHVAASICGAAALFLL